MSSEIRGEVEKDGKVLVLRRVHVRYLLRAGSASRDVIERARVAHVDSCPVARSIKECIGITTEVVYVG